jgi:hypothetical protein
MNQRALGIRVAMSFALLWALVVAGLNAWSETQIWNMEKLNAWSLRHYTPDGLPPSLPAASSLSARASLLAATLLSREAARSTGGRRAVFAEEAHAYLDHARNQRPNWAQATLVTLYTPAAGTSLNVVNPASLLKQSYLESPFLAKEGPWRVSQIIRHWPETDEITRASAAAEVDYLESLSRSMRVHIRLITAATPLGSR